MPKIAVNFDDVPNEIPPIESGMYTLLVDEASIEPTKDGKGEKLVVKMKIDDPSSKFHGRMVFDHISLKMETNLKRLGLSAGLKVGADGLEISDLVAKHVRARVKARTYKDPETGEIKETTGIAEYVI